MFCQFGHIKLIKSDNKDIYNTKKVNPKKNVHHGLHKNITQHNCFQHW